MPIVQLTKIFNSSWYFSVTWKSWWINSQILNMLRGIISALEKFDTLFGLNFGHLFGVSESLSKSLQYKDSSLQQGLSAVNLSKRFYKRQRMMRHPIAFMSGFIPFIMSSLMNLFH